MSRTFSLLSFLLLYTAATNAYWCGYQHSPDKDPATALQTSWKACGEPVLPGPYATPQVRDDYMKEKGPEYMALASFFNNGLKTCFYAAHDGATSDQMDTCQSSYRLLTDETGPKPNDRMGNDPLSSYR